MSISTLRGINPTYHLAREDVPSDLWPACRDDMGLERYVESGAPINCTKCRQRAAIILHDGR
jgi:hypothetical protein